LRRQIQNHESGARRISLCMINLQARDRLRGGASNQEKLINQGFFGKIERRHDRHEKDHGDDQEHNF
jgi:hypothetical protein